MSISSISASLSSLLSATASTTSTSSTSSLESAVNDAIENGDATASSLYSTLVTLGSQQADSSSDATTTYDAKGLLLNIKRNLLENNPLYSDNDNSNTTDLFSTLASSTTSDSSSNLDSLLSSLLDN